MSEVGAGRANRARPSGVIRTHRLAALLICCIAALLPACAPKPQTVHPSPGERGPAVGVELCWFVVDDDPYDDRLAVGEGPRALPTGTKSLVEVFAPYANRVIPVSPSTRALWRANGLRLISVPRKDFDQIRESLRLVGGLQQQQVGESTRWMEVAPSPTWKQTQSVVLDDGPLTLGPGRMRMLMRCWSAPASPVANAEIASDPTRRLESGALAGAIQLELVPQHVGTAPPRDLTAVLEPKPSEEAKGVMFPRLLLEASLTTDDLLFIVPERADAEWRQHPIEQPDPPGSHPLGPPVPAPPTLGELMLTDLATGAHRNTRLVLVIAPTPPRKYNLLAVK
jgi:hypothetical protein